MHRNRRTTERVNSLNLSKNYEERNNVAKIIDLEYNFKKSNAEGNSEITKFGAWVGGCGRSLEHGRVSREFLTAINDI